MDEVNRELEVPDGSVQIACFGEQQAVEDQEPSCLGGSVRRTPGFLI